MPSSLCALCCRHRLFVHFGFFSKVVAYGRAHPEVYAPEVRKLLNKWEARRGRGTRTPSLLHTCALPILWDMHVAVCCS